MCQLISSHPAPQKWARIEAGGEVFAEVEDAARPLGSGFFVGRIGAEKGEATLAPGKTKETRRIIVGGLAAPRLPPLSV
jgi:hypothetical protein